MSRRRQATEVQDSTPALLSLPADHVLNSGAVLFPGAFDLHGCPLIIFPVDGQVKLSSDLSKAEVVDFINYFLSLHNKQQEKRSLVSVVADLRHALPATSRFIAETLHLLEVHQRTVHTVYMILPKKKDAVKLLLKLLVPSKSYTVTFKKVLLKEVSELSSYIDRSQLTASLGGYLIYCHQSWVTFIKEIDAFVQDFLSAVERLPSCIATLQALSRLSVPSSYEELQRFCSTNEAKFQQLRRELGLDELLRHCEQVVAKLRYPETDPSYQAMAGTALFTHTAFDMLQNYNRITAAVEKVELLWQQAFSTARIHLHILQLREEAMRITEQIETLLKEKLQPYRIEIAKDVTKARQLKSDFESSIYTFAMALVRCAEDVIHTLAEMLPFGDSQARERWVLDLEILKDKLYSAVDFPYQTLRAVSDFYHYYNKSNSWYSLVLCENFLQELLSGIDSAPRQWQQGVPVWRQALSAFLKRNPCPAMEDLVQLAHLANLIPDGQLQQTGQQLSERCMILRKLLSCQGPVAISDLQLALQWQYAFLRHANHLHQAPTDLVASRGAASIQDGSDATRPLSGKTLRRSEHDIKKTSRRSQDDIKKSSRRSQDDNTQCRGSLPNLNQWGTGKEANPLGTSPVGTGMALLVEGKPPSLSSFDSGFDGAGSGGHLEAGGGRDGWEGPCRSAGTRDSFRPISRQPQIHEENASSMSDSEERREEFDVGLVGNGSRAGVRIIPQIAVDSLNLEIKVRRSTTLPANPWLSLPVDDLEKSYTVTVTQNPPGSALQRDPQGSDPSELYYSHFDMSIRSLDQPTQTEVPASTQNKALWTRDWTLQSQSSLEDPELSPICNVLSSTITDGQDQSNCITEGHPTLLWDSYDFHDQNQDATDGLSSSVVGMCPKDWDVKEQEGLREVEEILDRADGILEEEEKVLAQEVMLDVLWRSENRKNQWALWDSKDHIGVMSPSDLVEAGVLGLEDGLAPGDLEDHSDWKPLHSSSQTEAPEDHECYVEAVSPTGSAGLRNRADLLTELRKVNILDELIVEESLKIHELRRNDNVEENGPPGEKCAATTGPSITSKGREVFRLQLEREKKEVERMEKSLKKDQDRERKVKKHRSKARKIVKCSAMGKMREENVDEDALRNGLSSGSQSECRDLKHLTSVAPHKPLEPCTSKSSSISVSPGSEPLVDGQSNDGADPGYDPKSLNGSVAEPAAPSMTPLCTSLDLKESSEGMKKEPQDCMNAKELDAWSGENGSTLSPEATAVPEMGPGDRAFDPGGNSKCTPVPKPRKASLGTSSHITEKETPPFAEVAFIVAPPGDSAPAFQQVDTQDALPKPKERKHKSPGNCDTIILNPNVKEHCNNNNNNNPLTEQVISPNVKEHYNNNNNNNPLTKQVTVSFDEHQCANETSPQEKMAPESVGTLHIDLDDQTEAGSSPAADGCLNPPSPPPPEDPPDLPVTSCDPGGGRVSDGVDTCEATRISGTRSPVHQPQLGDINGRAMTAFKTPIVLDTGSGLMKAGFADQDLPTTIFPTIIGLPKYEDIINGHIERDAYIGHEAQHMRGVLTLKYPIKNGIIQNWDEMEKIWHHTFQQLRVDPEDHPVLLTEAAMNPLTNRQRMVEVMFECFSVPLTYVAMQAVLALYAAGRTTGVVFDSGDGVSHSVPVYDGYCLAHAVQRVPLAGLDVTMHLKKLLQEQGVCMRTTAEMEIVREMKEKCCCVALNYEEELSGRGSASGEMYYTLPDGQIICLNTERFRAPEILFKPELIGRDHYGIHKSIFKSILGSDIDLRRSFLGNIVLSGGNTLLPGLPERLQNEIGGMVPSDLGDGVHITSPKDRDFSVWSGGAVLANLPSFYSAWISREEYEEFGPQIVFRKCF